LAVICRGMKKSLHRILETQLQLHHIKDPLPTNNKKKKKKQRRSKQKKATKTSGPNSGNKENPLKRQSVCNEKP
jgi:hypothetical protein